MALRLVVRLLSFISYGLGAVVVLAGFSGYLHSNSKIPLYIALAVIIVGPVEDILNKIFPSEESRELINQLTSIAFLILLGLILLSG